MVFCFGAGKKALYWLARLNASDLTAAQEHAFFIWLAASPLNQLAYLKAEQLWWTGISDRSNNNQKIN